MKKDANLQEVAERIKKFGKHYAPDSLTEMDCNAAAEIISCIRTGRWIKNKGYDDRDNLFTCSECGRTINVMCGETLTDYPYCHCGSKMLEISTGSESKRDINE